MKLAGQTAIVTGSGRGIGFAIARKFAEEGANVVLADVIPLDEPVRQLGLPSDRVMAAPLDVTSQPDAERVVQEAIGRFGKVDILVNNAAIAQGIKVGPFEELEVEAWRRMLEVNTIGVFIMCRAISPHFRSRRYGRIVNITSGTAIKGLPGMLHYVASKGAVMSMTRSLATELGSDDITVNAVSPGFTETEAAISSLSDRPDVRYNATQTRAIKRVAQPADVAHVVFLLSTEEARFVTGQIVPADGGSVMG
ncbi:MAG: glucose 1-dehydrogenase [Caulobacteraceae bacterium]|nr:glucose 1-dehydrogenase [Caulobacteraceae bacterium]